MSTCNACGAKVDWREQDGRWNCYQPGTDTDHWDHCSARRWQQTVSTGTRFEGKNIGRGRIASGYANSIHGTKFDHIEALVIVGKKYKPDGCDCGLPPWELCKDDCQHAIRRKPS